MALSLQPLIHLSVSVRPLPIYTSPWQIPHCLGIATSCGLKAKLGLHLPSIMQWTIIISSLGNGLCQTKMDGLVLNWNQSGRISDHTFCNHLFPESAQYAWACEVYLLNWDVPCHTWTIVAVETTRKSRIPRNLKCPYLNTLGGFSNLTITGIEDLE